MQEKKDSVQVKNSVAQVVNITGFRALWFAQIASQIATNTLLFVLALRVFEITKSNTAVSGLFVVYGVPTVIFGIVGGAIVDKLDKRRILLLCDVIRAFLSLAFLLFPTNISYLYLLLLINALVSQFYVPAEGPTIPFLVPKDTLVTANSLFSFTYFSSLALGSVFAGPVLRFFGPTGVFLALSLLFIIAALFVLQIPTFEQKTRPLKELLAYKPSYLLSRIIANVQEGLAYVRKHKALLDAIVLLTGTQIMLALLGSLGPGFATLLGIDVHDASLVITGPAVLGIITGALWVGNIGYRIKPQKLINIGISAAGVILCIVSLLVWAFRAGGAEWVLGKQVLVPWTLLLFFLLGVANSLLDVPANATLQEKAEGEIRGRVYGLLAASVSGVGVLPIIMGGFLADVIGVGKVVLLLGILISIYSVHRWYRGTI